MATLTERERRESEYRKRLKRRVEEEARKLGLDWVKRLGSEYDPADPENKPGAHSIFRENR